MTFVCGGKVFEPVLEVDFVRITNLSLVLDWVSKSIHRSMIVILLALGEWSVTTSND
jgi:hypothetical protein